MRDRGRNISNSEKAKENYERGTEKTLAKERKKNVGIKKDGAQRERDRE